jgi:hypothetical protein
MLSGIELAEVGNPQQGRKEQRLKSGQQRRLTVM